VEPRNGGPGGGTYSAPQGHQDDHGLGDQAHLTAEPTSAAAREIAAFDPTRRTNTQAVADLAPAAAPGEGPEHQQHAGGLASAEGSSMTAQPATATGQAHDAVVTSRSRPTDAARSARPQRPPWGQWRPPRLTGRQHQIGALGLQRLVVER
jgi:hypothetical protein